MNRAKSGFGLVRDVNGLAGGVFREGSAEGKKFVVQDSLASLRRALRHLEGNPTQNELALLHRILTRADQEERSVLEIVGEEKLLLSVGLAATIGLLLLGQWEQAGGKDLDWGWALIESHVGREEEHRGVFHDLCHTAMAVFDIEQRSAPDAPLAAAQGFIQLAEWLGSQGNHADGLSCALSAANWLDYTPAADRGPADQLALQLARRGTEPIPILLSLVGPAIASAREAETNPAARLKSYDTFERLMRSCHQFGAVPPSVRPACEMLLKSQHLTTLRPAYLALTEPQLATPAAVEIIHTYFGPIWPGSRQEWLSDKVQNARRSIGALQEKQRGDLIGGVSGPLHADWNTWSIRLPMFQHAVPLNVELWSDPRCEDIVMATIHETTHVLCFAGLIGTAYRALRWAAFESEVRLRFVQLQTADEEIIKRLYTNRLPQALRTANAAFLAQAERGLELERKAQILRAVWSAWMEGVALFAETTEQPDRDDSISPVAGVLRHLIDHQDNIPRNEEDLAAFFNQHYEKIDRQVGELVRKAGEPRLRSHLQLHHEVYLAGYLAVRRVVAAWRHTLGPRPLTGTQAFRVLLHVTRFGDGAKIPHLSRPLREFEELSNQAMLAWVESLRHLSAADLILLIDNHRMKGETGTYIWENGALTRTTEADVGRLLESRVTRLAREALHSSGGPNADPERVNGASVELQAILTIVADLIEQAIGEVPVMPEATFQHWHSGMTMLPLAQTHASFWLVPAMSAVGCAMRTHGEALAGNDWRGKFWQFPLPPDEFASLQQRVQSGGPGRMTVMRFADLVGDETGTRQYLLWSYEDWTKVIPVGALFGLAEAEPAVREQIAERFAPNSRMTALEELTGPTHPCARRTSEWIKAHSWEKSGHERPVDLTVWSQHVGTLCEQVLAEDDKAIRLATNARLYAWTFADVATAERWTRHGARELQDEGLFGAWIRFLVASADKPAEVTPDLVENLAQLGIRLVSVPSGGMDVAQ